MRLRLSAMIAAVAAVVCAAPSVPGYTIIIWNAQYPSPGNTTDNRFDVFVPNAGAANAGATVIMLHGGSYIGGGRGELNGACGRLADLGYVAVNMDYKLATGGNPSFPQTMTDVYSMIAWVRTTGMDQYELPDTIILAGFSAGSTIASTAALAAETAGTFSMPPLEHPRGYRVDGLFHGFGRADLVWNVQIYGQITVIAYYLGTYMVDPASQALYAQASAVTHVTPCAPPTVLYHSINDGTVPFGNSQRLTDALIGANVPAQLHMQNAGHSYDTTGGYYGTGDTVAASIPWMLVNGQPECGRAGQGPTMGACCTATSCQVRLQAGCASLYLGDNTTCNPDPCPRGACCTSPSCAVVMSGECPGGIYAGNGTTCQPDLCPRGACCTGLAECELMIAPDCQGLWMGEGTVCSQSPCPPPSACCTFDQERCYLSYESECEGGWMSEPTTCTPDPCPVFGACCIGGGLCTILLEPDCVGPGGLWVGAETGCTPNPCPQPGACCVSGSCSITLQGGCAGYWFGPNSTCAGDPCTQTLSCCTGTSCTVTLREGCAGVAVPGHYCGPGVCETYATPGTCCTGATCAVRPLIQCAGPMQKYLTGQSTCNAQGNLVTPCCTADFNKNDMVGVQDVFSFLGAWFALSPSADVYGNGSAVPSVQSLFMFLGAWFAGCPAP